MFGGVAFSQAPYAALGGNTYLVAVAETSSASDTQSAESSYGGIVVEFSSGSAAFSNNANNFTATQAELAAATVLQTAITSVFSAQYEAAEASDSLVAKLDVLASLAEAGVATDSISANSAVLAALSELATALDAASGAISVAVSVTESASGTAQSSVSVAFLGTVAELAQAASTLSVIRTANVPVTGVQLYVRIGDALVWGVIDTNQNANWTIINDAQSPGWTDLPS